MWKRRWNSMSSRWLPVLLLLQRQLIPSLTYQGIGEAVWRSQLGNQFLIWDKNMKMLLLFLFFPQPIWDVWCLLVNIIHWHHLCHHQIVKSLSYYSSYSEEGTHAEECHGAGEQAATPQIMRTLYVFCSTVGPPGLSPRPKIVSQSFCLSLFSCAYCHSIVCSWAADGV